MRVVNLAHGVFLTLGGYSAVFVSDHGLNPWLAFILAPVVGFGMGLVTELLLVRKLYGRPLDTILATWGLAPGLFNAH
jgi:urea transport system permease protein